jgi:hypothetical protein
MMMVEQQPNVSVFRRLRRATALPLYAGALSLDYLSSALGRLAAWIAGDNWS